MGLFGDFGLCLGVFYLEYEVIDDVFCYFDDYGCGELFGVVEGFLIELEVVWDFGELFVYFW